MIKMPEEMITDKIINNYYEDLIEKYSYPPTFFKIYFDFNIETRGFSIEYYENIKTIKDVMDIKEKKLHSEKEKLYLKLNPPIYQYLSEPIDYRLKKAMDNYLQEFDSKFKFKAINDRLYHEMKNEIDKFLIFYKQKYEIG